MFCSPNLQVFPKHLTSRLLQSVQLRQECDRSSVGKLQSYKNASEIGVITKMNFIRHFFPIKRIMLLSEWLKVSWLALSFPSSRIEMSLLVAHLCWLTCSLEATLSATCSCYCSSSKAHKAVCVHLNKQFRSAMFIIVIVRVVCTAHLSAGYFFKGGVVFCYKAASSAVRAVITGRGRLHVVRLLFSEPRVLSEPLISSRYWAPDQQHRFFTPCCNGFEQNASDSSETSCDFTIANVQ